MYVLASTCACVCVGGGCGWVGWFIRVLVLVCVALCVFVWLVMYVLLRVRVRMCSNQSRHTFEGVTFTRMRHFTRKEQYLYVLALKKHFNCMIRHGQFVETPKFQITHKRCSSLYHNVICGFQKMEYIPATEEKILKILAAVSQMPREKIILDKVCCSALQCVAVCCGLLQCVVVWRCVLQCVVVCFSVLLSVAYCITLQTMMLWGGID